MLFLCQLTKSTVSQVAASCQAGAALLDKAAGVGNGLPGESGHSAVYLVAFVELSHSPLPLLLKLVIICTSEIQSLMSVGVTRWKKEYCSDFATSPFQVLVL